MKTLSNSDFLNQALFMKRGGQQVKFASSTVTEFQDHLLAELKSDQPKNFNEFLVRKINAMQGLQTFEEFHLWFLFQMLICTADQTENINIH